MQLGRILGIVAVVIGLFITWLAYSMLNEAGVTLKFFTFGPVLVALGIGLIIFPGGNITAKESKEKIKDPQVMIKEAPMNHKIAWIIFSIIGFIVANFILKF